MKKIKLDKKIQLLEDFSASELSKPSQSVTPAGQTQRDSVTVDKVVAQPAITHEPVEAIPNVISGEEVRSEILKDVDAILNNLEALSKQITEAALLEADAWFKDGSLFESVAINEEDGFFAKLFGQFKAAQAFATRIGTYAKMKKDEANAEGKKIELEGQFDAKKEQLGEEIKKKLRDKFTKQIDQVNQKDIPTETKAKIKEKIYAKRDEVEAKASKQIAEKIKAKKEAVSAKADQDIKAKSEATQKMLKDNPIDDEKYTNKWEMYKLEVDNKHEITLIEVKAEAADSVDKDADQLEKDEATFKAQMATAEKLKAEKEKDLDLAAKKIEDDAKKKLEGLAEDKKEAAVRITQYLAAKTALDKAKASGDEKKILQAEDVFANLDDITVKDVKLKDSNLSDEEAKAKLKEYTGSSKEPKKEPKKEDKPDKEELDTANKAVKDAKAAFDAIQDGDDEKAKLKAKIKVLQTRQKIAKLKGDDDWEVVYQGFGDEIGKVMKKIRDLKESVVNEANDMSVKKLSKYAGFKEVEYEGAVYAFKSKELGKMQFQAEPSFTTIDGNFRDDELNIEVDRRMANTAHAKVLGQIRGYKNIIAFLKGGGAEKYESGSLKEIEKYLKKFDFKSISESKLHESKNSKEIKELEKLLKSIKSNTPADQGRKASIQDDIERLKNEAVTESKLHESMTIAQKFKALM